MNNPAFDACLRELGPVFVKWSERYSSDVFLAAVALHFGNGLRAISDLGDTSGARELLRLTRRRAGISWWRVG